MYAVALLFGCFLAHVGAVPQEQLQKPLAIPVGCKHNGVWHAVGTAIKLNCFKMRCTTLGWRFYGFDQKCARCYVWHDPNFYTFDKNYYRWDGKCNYTIAQPFTIWNEHYGVHSSFYECSPGASCLKETTFKSDLHTAVTITHAPVPTIKINGISYTITPWGLISPHSLFGLQFWSCILLIGPHFALYVCHNFMILFAPQYHSGNLDGLCGHFDNDGGFNDHRLKDGPTFPTGLYPLEFPKSWLNIVQNDSRCCDKKYYLPRRFLQNQHATRQRRSTERVVEDECEGEDNYRHLCFEAAGSPSDPINDFVQRVIDSCVQQLCENNSDMDFWLNNVRETIRDLRQITGNGREEPEEDRL